MRSRTTLIEAVSQSYWVATVVSLPTLYLRAIKTSLASVFGSGFSSSGGRVSDVIARVMLPLVRLSRSYRLSPFIPAHVTALQHIFNRFCWTSASLPLRQFDKSGGQHGLRRRLRTGHEGDGIGHRILLGVDDGEATAEAMDVD